MDTIFMEVSLMLISYDVEADALYMKFGSGKPRESLEIDDGIILDISED